MNASEAYSLAMIRVENLNWTFSPTATAALRVATHGRLDARLWKGSPRAWQAVGGGQRGCVCPTCASPYLARLVDKARASRG